MARAIAQAIEAGTTKLIVLPEQARASIAVPAGLRGYEVEQTSVGVFDRLLGEEVSHD